MRKQEIIDLFLRKALLGKKRFPHGVACTYIQLNKELGVKCYLDDSENRNFSYRVQKKLSELKLAPKIYFKFEINFPFDTDLGDTQVVFCYVTQHAEKCGAEFPKQLPELYAALQQNGVETEDVAQRNCGLIDGKLILIDCDHYSQYVR